MYLAFKIFILHILKDLEYHLKQEWLKYFV